MWIKIKQEKGGIFKILQSRFSLRSGIKFINLGDIVYILVIDLDNKYLSSFVK